MKLPADRIVPVTVIPLMTNFHDFHSFLQPPFAQLGLSGPESGFPKSSFHRSKNEKAELLRNIKLQNRKKIPVPGTSAFSLPRLYRLSTRRILDH